MRVTLLAEDGELLGIYEVNDYLEPDEEPNRMSLSALTDDLSHDIKVLKAQGKE